MTYEKSTEVTKVYQTNLKTEYGKKNKERKEDFKMEKKITKREMFEMIKKEVADREEIVDREKIIDFCNHEIELLDKKRGSVNEKKLAEREVEMKVILDALKSCEKPVTVTELSRVNYEVGLMSPSKITSRLGMLKDAKLVDSAKDGKANKYFVIAE